LTKSLQPDVGVCGEEAWHDCGQHQARGAHGDIETQHPRRPAAKAAHHVEGGPRGASSVPENLVIVTKLGARRGAEGSWIPGFSREQLTQAVHDNLRNVTPRQIADARRICEIACVQNHYNLAHRSDDALIDDLAAQGVAYVPFFFPAPRLHPANGGGVEWDCRGRMKAIPDKIGGT
jgi:hypothetical protein